VLRLLNPWLIWDPLEGRMTAKSNLLETAVSWAAPTEEEIRAWESLPRDQQLAQLRALFDEPASNVMSKRSYGEIIAAARQKARQMRHG